MLPKTFLFTMFASLKYIYSGQILRNGISAIDRSYPLLNPYIHSLTMDDALVFTSCYSLGCYIYFVILSRLVICLLTLCYLIHHGVR